MNEPQKPVGAIFDAAIELPPERRAAYVQEACAGDDPLHQRVEALLRAHESAETFMDSPAVDPRADDCGRAGIRAGECLRRQHRRRSRPEARHGARVQERSQLACARV